MKTTKTHLISIILLISLLYNCSIENEARQINPKLNNYKPWMVLSSLIIGLAKASYESSNDGLVAYYPFNGNANDESGNAYNGIISGAQLTSDRFGNSNSAYIFDGVNDYIEIDTPNNSALEIGYLDYSIAVWIKTSSASTSGRIFSKGSSGCVTGYMMRLSDIGKIHKEDAVNNICSPLESASIVTDDNWHLVVETVDRDLSSKIYIDGYLNSASFQTNEGSLSNNRKPRIGINDVNPTIEAFIGKIDDLRVYNRILSDIEILKLYDLYPTETVTFNPSSYPTKASLSSPTYQSSSYPTKTLSLNSTYYPSLFPTNIPSISIEKLSTTSTKANTKNIISLSQSYSTNDNIVLYIIIGILLGLLIISIIIGLVCWYKYIKKKPNLNPSTDQKYNQINTDDKPNIQLQEFESDQEKGIDGLDDEDIAITSNTKAGNNT